jgi:hypothetical protein
VVCGLVAINLLLVVLIVATSKKGKKKKRESKLDQQQQQDGSSFSIITTSSHDHDQAHTPRFEAESNLMRHPIFGGSQTILEDSPELKMGSSGMRHLSGLLPHHESQLNGFSSCSNMKAKNSRIPYSLVDFQHSSSGSLQKTTLPIISSSKLALSRELEELGKIRNDVQGVSNIVKDE